MNYITRQGNSLQESSERREENRVLGNQKSENTEAAFDRRHAGNRRRPLICAPELCLTSSQRQRGAPRTSSKLARFNSLETGKHARHFYRTEARHDTAWTRRQWKQKGEGSRIRRERGAKVTRGLGNSRKCGLRWLLRKSARMCRWGSGRDWIENIPIVNP